MSPHLGGGGRFRFVSPFLDTNGFAEGQMGKYDVAGCRDRVCGTVNLSAPLPGKIELRHLAVLRD